MFEMSEEKILKKDRANDVLERIFTKSYLK